MLSALVSIKKPSDNSNDFYRCFYNCYNMLQVSDFVLRECYSKCSNRDDLIKQITEGCNGNEYKDARIFTMCMGLNLKGLEERDNEVRGFENFFIDELIKQKEDPIEWYLKVNEFILLYAYTDQGLKSFLRYKGKDKLFRENQLMRFVCDVLKETNIKEDFLKKINLLSNSVISDEDTLIKVWDYFTKIRNLFMHSGGFITEKFVCDLKELKLPIGKKLMNIDTGLDLIWNSSESSGDEFLFKFSLEPQKLFIITENFINFFRNFVLIILESLDEFYKKS
ncbi:TM1812 family CRISPR-associated protein [Clostridium perfringens]|uniref:TM1812 family CRISPR-associated protein n=1 Tax=Clostridium perfringens TaxID=1502 RepID=UPI0024485203|nr:TM1812 family CRISPR-associated protein [Clostridium perfringens]MDH2460356.1 hypothetical protein [Clostridium perfringens]